MHFARNFKHEPQSLLNQVLDAFARARELAAETEDIAARFSAYYGMWMVSFARADLAPMREVAVALSAPCLASRTSRSRARLSSLASVGNRRGRRASSRPSGSPPPSSPAAAP
jgi:hypothetical protein